SDLEICFNSASPLSNFEGEDRSEEFSDNSEKFVPIGTLARINLDISAEANLEPIINSLKEIQLRGLERIKITNLEKREEV
ncbi:6347_t:CDS:2, partial [Paraglomus brasilianum]